jgi:molybdopterin adenylyltransferase
VGVLTCSTSGALGRRDDESGRLLRDTALRYWGVEVAAYAVVLDDRRAIARRLKTWSDSGLDVIFTTGGTGLSPTDVTPEATRDVLHREAPGLAEAMRAAGARKTPLAWLSRGVCGLRGGTLIVNLPGGPRGVRDGLAALRRLLPHAVEIARGAHRGKHKT